MAIKKQEERKVEKVESLHQNIIEELFKSEKNFHDQIIKETSEIRLQISETRKDIQSAVTPKFIEMSSQVKDLVELSIEIWRLENRINKINSNLEENQKEGINNSIQKIKRYLDKNDIELIDHTNHKFNEGRNLDILAVEKDSNLPEAIVKETKEPTVMYKGQVVRKGKVVVITPEEEKELGNVK